MKRSCLYLVVILCHQISFANNGSLFDVTSTTTQTGAILNITTTIPNHTYSMAGIKLNSSGYSLPNSGTECTKIENGHCFFSINNLTTKTITISGKVGTIDMSLCLNGNGPLSCQNYQVSISYAYVANDNNKILVCPIHSNGDFGDCFDSGASFSGPNVLTFNTAKTMAYITNYDLSFGTSSIQLCTVQPNYTLTSCNTLTNTGSAALSVPFGLVLNRAQTIAYIANGAGSPGQVLVCPINGNHIACENSGNTGIPFTYPQGIVFNQAQTIAYVTNDGIDEIYPPHVNAVSVCPIIAGTFGACIDSGHTGPAFSNPLGIVLNNSGTIAYVTNTDSTNTVSICPIQNDGTFGTCVDSGNTFNAPIWIVLNGDGTKAYVTNNTTNTVSVCPINSDGSFGACQNAGNIGGIAFSGPEGITLLE